MTRATKNDTDKPETPSTTPETSTPVTEPTKAADTTSTTPVTREDKIRVALKGNRNGIRHGLTAGLLPKNCEYVEIRMNNFRRQLEDAVLAIKDEITMTDAAAIQTCLRWERHGMLAQRWLRLESNNLKPADRLNFSREIARASAERDKALKQLDLDAPPRNPWEALDVETNDD